MPNAAGLTADQTAQSRAIADGCGVEFLFPGQMGKVCPRHTGKICLGLLGFAFQGALEGLVEGGFGFLVLRLRDLALAAFDFELEEFFLEAFEQHGSGTRRRGRADGRGRGSRD